MNNIEKVEKKKVVCLYCGHPTNTMQAKDVNCKGIYLKCKNKECKKEFELRI